MLSIKGWIILSISIFLVFIIIFPFTYFNEMKSDTYLTATRFIRKNTTIKGYIGELESVRLAIMGKHYTRYVGDKGYCESHLIVSGKSQKVRVHIYMEMINTKWEVKACNLTLNNGEVISILKSAESPLIDDIKSGRILF
ncbi:MAG: hypothetical protein A2293_15730 [Elusimicrobia bacterium RIFOXYB2_FULL_49_7]|nr:MAG: hypothetical protein A2293_15730 [Elusimicrobia bacterium RIFOXYB2_FULL_49_7]